MSKIGSVFKTKIDGLYKICSKLFIDKGTAEKSNEIEEMTRLIKTNSPKIFQKFLYLLSIKYHSFYIC